MSRIGKIKYAQAPAEALSTGELGALTEDTTHRQLREHTHAWYALF